MALFGNTAQMAAMQKHIDELEGRVTALFYSKQVMLPRLTGTPDSFSKALDAPVTDVSHSGMVTSFVLGGDVMRVVLDATTDSVRLEPIRYADQLKAIVVPLRNSAGGDYGPTEAAKINQAYTTFRDGPAPDPKDLAVAFNGHLIA